MTFSIIAFDKNTGAIGSAGASKYIALGADIPVYRPGVGLVHAQSYIYPRGARIILDHMERGTPPHQLIINVLAEISSPEIRQYIICSAKGEFTVYSGADCHNHFRAEIGGECAAAGNCLADIDIPAAMIEAYENTHAPMHHRLLAALEAGQMLGGDARGKEAAYIKIFEPDYPDITQTPVDLRVDYHDNPLTLLRIMVEEQDRRGRDIVINKRVAK